MFDDLFLAMYSELAAMRGGYGNEDHSYEAKLKETKNQSTVQSTVLFNVQ